MSCISALRRFCSNEWLSALEEAEHVVDFYIVTEKKSTFDTLRERIEELLGSIIVTEEEKRSMAAGFPSNLEYFRLDFWIKIMSLLVVSFARFYRSYGLEPVQLA